MNVNGERRHLLKKNTKVKQIFYLDLSSVVIKTQTVKGQKYSKKLFLMK